MNDKQKVMIELIKSKMTNLPKDHDELALFVESAFNSCSQNKPVISLSELNNEEMLFIDLSGKYMARLVSITIDRGFGDKFVYASQVIDYLKRQKYTSRLSSMLCEKGIDLEKEMKKYLVKNNFIEVLGKKIKITSKGMEKLKDIQENKKGEF